MNYGSTVIEDCSCHPVGIKLALIPRRRQAIAWNDGGQALWRHMSSLDKN